MDSPPYPIFSLWNKLGVALLECVLAMNKDDKIEKEFWKTFGNMPDDLFWLWVGTWKDAGTIKDDCDSWDIKDLESGLKDMKDIQQKYEVVLRRK
jgi:hypothetical protein